MMFSAQRRRKTERGTGPVFRSFATDLKSGFLSSLGLPLLLVAHTAAGVNVRDYGAKGDGLTDDTEAIRAAVKGASDGVVEFPAGRYRITRTVAIRLPSIGPLGLEGRGGSATIVMDGSGPAFHISGSHNGSAQPATVADTVWLKERMFRMDGLEITGTHPEADGIVLSHLMQPVIRGCLIRKVRHGIRLVQRNRNVLLEGNHIYDCAASGIFLDQVNLHQINIGNCHISYCREAGILTRGGEIRNFQITGNDIEYNCDPDKEGPAADIFIDLSKGGNVREGTISGNTIQAVPSRGGANIRFEGNEGAALKLGLWSITGNHISNQETGILLRNIQGISITGNTFVRCYGYHLFAGESRNLVVSGNVVDHNSDYFTPEVVAAGGVRFEKCEGVIFSDNLVDGIMRGSAGRGGAVEIHSSRYVTLRGCTLSNPAYKGLEIIDGENLLVSENVIFTDRPGAAPVAVSLEGNCPGTRVRGNRTGTLKIHNKAKYARVRR